MSDIVQKRAQLNKMWPGLSPVKKAEVTRSFLSANGGYLLETQLNEVILILQEAASILGVADIVPMNSHTMRMDTMRFVGSVIHLGQECETTPATNPTMGNPQLLTKEFVARTKISYSAMEDAVGGPEDFISKLLNALTRACAADLERLVISGDTTLPPTNFLSAWNGMLASAVTNIHNAAGANFSKTVANEMVEILPDPFKRNHRDLNFFLDRSSDQSARNSDASRATELGDNRLTSHEPINYFGIDLLPSDVWPKNLGPGNNETEVILTSPSNIKVGIWRDIRVESETSAVERCVSYVLSFRAAFVYLEETAVAKATDVLVG